MPFSRVSFLGITIVWLAGCAAHAPRPAALRPAPAVPSATALGVTPTTNLAAQADIGTPALPASHCPSYAASMARGRALAAGQQYLPAIAAFDDAVRARPYDAPARLERGRAWLALGKPSIEDFEQARSLSGDVALQAAALLGVATIHELAKRAEPARLALAIAASLGSTEAAQRLAGRSTCTSSWATTQLDNLQIVSSWSEALAQRQLVGCESEATPNSEAAARKELCRDCQSGTLSQANACEGPGPYRIATGYMHCSVFALLVQPLAGNRLYLDSGGGNPVQPTGNGFMLDVQNYPDVDWTSGGFADGAQTSFNGERWSDSPEDTEPAECPIDTSSEVETPYTTGCQAGPGTAKIQPHTRRWFDKSGKALLEVNEYAGAVRVTLTGNRARLDGAGCAETVALRR